MSKAYKGRDYEREICKLLSKWWTKGERDDVFWRSSQSGGRATFRTQKGLRTHGSYGDVAAVDPIGEPLLKLLTIELKRGSSYGHPGELLDYSADVTKHPWSVCLAQAIRSSQEANSIGWMMICRRDHRRSIAYVDATVFRHFQGRDHICPRMRFILGNGEDDTNDFVGVPLEGFLSAIPPEEIIRVLNLLK